MIISVPAASFPVEIMAAASADPIFKGGGEIKSKDEEPEVLAKKVTKYMIQELKMPRKDVEFVGKSIFHFPCLFSEDMMTKMDLDKFKKKLEKMTEKSWKKMDLKALFLLQEHFSDFLGKVIEPIKDTLEDMIFEIPKEEEKMSPVKGPNVFKLYFKLIGTYGIYPAKNYFPSLSKEKIEKRSEAYNKKFKAYFKYCVEKHMSPTYEILIPMIFHLAECTKMIHPEKTISMIINTLVTPIMLGLVWINYFAFIGKKFIIPYIEDLLNLSGYIVARRVPEIEQVVIKKDDEGYEIIHMIANHALTSFILFDTRKRTSEEPKYKADVVYESHPRRMIINIFYKSVRMDHDTAILSSFDKTEWITRSGYEDDGEF